MSFTEPLKEFASMDEARSNGYRAFQYTASGIIVRKELRHGIFDWKLVKYRPES